MNELSQGLDPHALAKRSMRLASPLYMPVGVSLIFERARRCDSDTAACRKLEMQRIGEEELREPA